MEQGGPGSRSRCRIGRARMTRWRGGAAGQARRQDLGHTSRSPRVCQSILAGTPGRATNLASEDTDCPRYASRLDVVALLRFGSRKLRDQSGGTSPCTRVRSSTRRGAVAMPLSDLGGARRGGVTGVALYRAAADARRRPGHQIRTEIEHGRFLGLLGRFSADDSRQAPRHSGAYLGSSGGQRR